MVGLQVQGRVERAVMERLPSAFRLTRWSQISSVRATSETRPMPTADVQSPASLRELAETSNAWPFEEAKKIVARLKKKPKDEVIFETGYGPSGLPHIGTFGEVARTTMVRH